MKDFTSRREFFLGTATAAAGMYVGVNSSPTVSMLNAAESPVPKQHMRTPIVWYWAGPGTHNDVNEKTVSQLAAGGWTMAWDMGWPRTGEPKYLDLYHRHGLKVALNLARFVEEWEPKADFNFDDREQTRELDELIDRVRNHPAVYAYFLWDEPNASRFPFFGRFVAHLRKLDPTRPAIVNLYPTYASSAQLGTDSYQEHLQQFVKTVRPDVLSYDHYPFVAGADFWFGHYFLNLGLVREAAVKAGVPFINIIQSSPWIEWDHVATEGEVRWQVYTSLAYGAQGICHFVYNARHVSRGLFKDSPESETPLPIWWAIGGINREFVAIAEELQPLKSHAAYHIGAVPRGGVALPADSRFTVESGEGNQGFVLGCFGKSDSPSTHVVLVNMDYNSAAAVTLKAPAPIDLFHAPTGEWTRCPEGSRMKLDLPPGGGWLVRLR